MRESKLQVAFSIWGPIKITIDKRAQELWGKVTGEAVRKAFTTVRGGRARIRKVSPQAGKARERTGRRKPNK